MKDEAIQISQVNQVVYITLNRPKSFNSFNRPMALSLISALEKIAGNPDIRAIVLTGSGKAFCAGQDLVEVTDASQNPGFQKILEEHYNPIIKAIRTIEKPVIASVNGVAAGAGANIALACDVVLASTQASFIQAFSKIGLVPDSGGTYFLPRLIGFQKASALMMLGDKVTAEEALGLGMIYKVVPAENLEEVTQNLANKMAAMPTQALGYTKRLLNQTFSNSLEAQLSLESALQIQSAQSEDYQEGVAAFIEKRTPQFKGK